MSIKILFLLQNYCGFVLYLLNLGSYHFRLGMELLAISIQNLTAVETSLYLLTKQ